MSYIQRSAHALSPQVFASEFFAERLTLHRIAWSRASDAPFVVDTQVIDNGLGPAYGVVVADLTGA